MSLYSHPALWITNSMSLLLTTAVLHRSFSSSLACCAFPTKVMAPPGSVTLASYEKGHTAESAGHKKNIVRALLGRASTSSCLLVRVYGGTAKRMHMHRIAHTCFRNRHKASADVWFNTARGYPCGTGSAQEPGGVCTGGGVVGEVRLLVLLLARLHLCRHTVDVLITGAALHAKSSSQVSGGKVGSIVQQAPNSG